MGFGMQKKKIRRPRRSIYLVLLARRRVNPPYLQPPSSSIPMHVTRLPNKNSYALTPNAF